MSQLPQAWTTATLKDLVGSRGLFTDGDWILSEHFRTGSDVRLVQLADIGVGRFLNKSQKTISKTTAEELRVTLLDENDVLISRMADPLARACLFPKLEQPSITAVDVAIARPDQSVSLPEFMMHLCNSQLVLNQAEAVAVGTTRKRISRRNLEKLSVPLPPLSEQGRIVAKLGKLLSRVDAAQARLANIPRILKRFRQSILAAACSGRLTADWRIENREVESALKLLKRVDAERKKRDEARIKKSRAASSQVLKKPNYLNYDIAECNEVENLPSTWVQAPVGFLCDCIVPGRDKPKSFSGSIPWVTLPDITGTEVWDCLSGLRLSESEIKTVRARIIPTDSVVMSCIGRFGVSAVVKQPVVVNQQLHAFLQSDAVLPSYLAYNIRTLTPYMHSLATQTTIAYLNKDNCNSLPVSVPPMSEQQEIVRRVEALFKTADALEARYRTAKAHVDKLTQSILAKAFRGELVPQDPNDEPASALLRRIREDRSKQQKTASTGKLQAKTKA